MQDIFQIKMLTGFSDEKIISLPGVHSIWAKRACREIWSRKQDFVPLLLDVLDKTIKDTLNEDFGTGDVHIAAALMEAAEVFEEKLNGTISVLAEAERSTKNAAELEVIRR